MGKGLTLQESVALTSDRSDAINTIYSAPPAPQVNTSPSSVKAMECSIFGGLSFIMLDYKRNSPIWIAEFI
jgi:hypothetical protein